MRCGEEARLDEVQFTGEAVEWLCSWYSNQDFG